MQIDILAEGLAFPEGPVFAPDGSLWFVEYERGAVTRWKAGQLDRRRAGTNPNGLALDQGGRAWVCDAGQNAIRRSDAAVHTWETVVGQIDGQPLLMPNDLAFDVRGNLVFTCPGPDTEASAGYVCCMRPDGRQTKVAEHMAFPNGLAFSDGGRTLVVAETYRRRLWRGAWDDVACRWIDPEPWAEVGGATDGPDGMAFGADGLLYVAVYSIGCIKAVAHDGATVAVYELPGSNPTNCAFDPAGRLGLVVTEAEHGVLLSLGGMGSGAPLFG
jgi:gluconolactonase